MQHINYIFGKLWPFGWSVSICTLYSVSPHSTSSIDPLLLCNSEPILDSVGRHTVCSILIMFGSCDCLCLCHSAHARILDWMQAGGIPGTGHCESRNMISTWVEVAMSYTLSQYGKPRPDTISLIQVTPRNLTFFTSFFTLYISGFTISPSSLIAIYSRCFCTAPV